MAHHKHKTNRRSFTPRKRRLLQNLASGKFHSNYQAAIAAGYAPGATAKNAASRVLKEARETYPEALARLGLTPDAIIRKYLKPALEAADWRDFIIDGTITPGPEHPAWETRTKALDMLHKILGAYQSHSEGTETGASITVQFASIAQPSNQPPQSSADSPGPRPFSVATLPPPP